MTVEKVRQFYHARPFHPFVLHLADGRNIKVSHPEFMAFSPSGRVVVVIGPDDSSHHLDLLLITDVVVRANGRGARHKSKTR